MNDAVPPLAALRRNLAAASRNVTAVLELLAEGETRVADMARRLGVDHADVRDALMALEASGLAESRTYVITPLGAKVYREEAAA